jgi:hypothetical protein
MGRFHDFVLKGVFVLAKQNPLHFRTGQARNHRGNRIGQVEPSFSQTRGPKVKYCSLE